MIKDLRYCFRFFVSYWNAFYGIDGNFRYLYYCLINFDVLWGIV